MKTVVISMVHEKHTPFILLEPPIKDTPRGGHRNTNIALQGPKCSSSHIVNAF